MFFVLVLKKVLTRLKTTKTNYFAEYFYNSYKAIIENGVSVNYFCTYWETELHFIDLEYKLKFLFWNVNDYIRTLETQISLKPGILDILINRKIFSFTIDY